MSSNLVSTVMQFLTPDMIGRIASALGLNRSDAQSGISAAVPALLAALSGLADKPGGAQSLVNTIKQQSGVVDNFSSIIGGSNQASFIERGASLLTSLLGGQDSNGLINAIGRFSGLGQTRSTSLVGMLAPLLMGLIGKHLGARGVDVGSLTSLFASQRDEIAQALPPGMGQMLQSAGLTSGPEPLRTTPGPTPAQVSRVGSRPESGVPGWVYWVLPLLALAGLLWYLLSRPHEQLAQHETAPARQERQTTAPQAPQTTTGQAERTTPGHGEAAGDVKTMIGDSLADMRTSLQGITDASSAQAALPKLEATKNEIERASGLVHQLSPEQRRMIAGIVAPSLPFINQLTDRVMSIPGVSDMLKPTIDPMKTKLAELSGQPTTTGAGR
jgi:Bacterial protein of unknown function (DUF937)